MQSPPTPPDDHVLGGAPEPLVRSVFFYNATPQLGSRVGLHFFEPRYRILAMRAQDPSRGSQFLFLPNFADYQASHGDIGMLATIVKYEPVPTGESLPLKGRFRNAPRANVMIQFEARAMVLFHWLEPGSAGLTECTCAPLPDNVLPRGLEPPTLDAPLDAWLEDVSAEGGYSVVGLLQHPAQHAAAIQAGEAEPGAGCFAEPSRHADPTGYGAGLLRLPPATKVRAVGVPRARWLQHEAGWSSLALFKPEESVAKVLRARHHTAMYSGLADTGYLLHSPDRASAAASLAIIDRFVPGIAQARCVCHDGPGGSVTPHLHVIMRPSPDQLCSADELVYRLARAHLALSDRAAKLRALTAEEAAGGGGTSAAAADGDGGDGDGDGDGDDDGGGGDGSGTSAGDGEGDGGDESLSALSALPLRTLKARLDELCVSPKDSGCIEKEDVARLLHATLAEQRQRQAAREAASPGTRRLERRMEEENAVLSAAARQISRTLTSLAVPVACGVPTGGLAVRECSFTRDSDPTKRHFELLDADDSRFVVDERQEVTLRSVMRATYTTVRRASDGTEHELGWEESYGAHDSALTVSSLLTAGAATDLARSSKLRLTPVGSAPEDALGAACIVLPATAAQVWRRDVDTAVKRTRQALTWPKVRLLFIAADRPSAAADEAEGGGSALLFARLDRELVWLIAEAVAGEEGSGVG